MAINSINSYTSTGAVNTTGKPAAQSTSKTTSGAAADAGKSANQSAAGNKTNNSNLYDSALHTVNSALKSQALGVARAQMRYQEGVDFTADTQAALKAGRSKLTRMNEITQTMGKLSTTAAEKAKLAKEYNTLRTDVQGIDNTAIQGIKPFTEEGRAALKDKGFNETQRVNGKLGDNGEFAPVSDAVKQAGLNELSAAASTNDLSKASDAIGKVDANLAARETTVDKKQAEYNKTLNRLSGRADSYSAALNRISNADAVARRFNASVSGGVAPGTIMNFLA